ncbi:MAG: Zn-dependent hydrolase [Chloroflexi bacterium]|nr:Zn-dependent hydrolase [Chloroflexota bacterium]
MPSPKINALRLNHSLEDLGRIGHTDQGMQRVAFSAFDVEGRAHTMDLMRRVGLEVTIDPAGNIIGRRDGSEPGLAAIALGSHIDTVPSGGKYDGALGVMGAIECLQTLQDQRITTRHPLEVLVFTNEEGTGFPHWLFGSRAMAGSLAAEDLTAVDQEGIGLETRLQAIGGDLSRIHEAARSPGELSAYFELHIEQGPALDRSGTPIGVVTGITGRAAFEVEVAGAANHAGTTPMGLRHDALLSASRLILTVERIASELEICRVGTVGRVSVSPNATNVVPGTVAFSVEFRDVDSNALTAAEAEFRRNAAEVEASDGVSVDIQALPPTIPAPIKPEMQDLVAEASANHGLATERLPSGAGHDAQAMAAITGVAMIFVPSIDGISHSPLEFSTPQACADGAQVLLDLLLLADQRE